MEEAWERAVEVARGKEDAATVKSLTLDSAVKCFHGRLPPPSLLQAFVQLQKLSLANIGLTLLVDFPCLPNLEVLILTDNRIAWGLKHLVEAGLSSLRELDLSNNKIQNLEDLAPLSELRLISLDLYKCPVTSIVDYRGNVFYMIKTLQYLDNMDVEHKEKPESEEEEDESEDDEGEGNGVEQDSNGIHSNGNDGEVDENDESETSEDEDNEDEEEDEDEEEEEAENGGRSHVETVNGNGAIKASADADSDDNVQDGEESDDGNEYGKADEHNAAEDTSDRLVSAEAGTDDAVDDDQEQEEEEEGEGEEEDEEEDEEDEEDYGTEYLIREPQQLEDDEGASEFEPDGEDDEDEDSEDEDEDDEDDGVHLKSPVAEKRKRGEDSSDKGRRAQKR